jgi:hypothetical protein
VKEPLYLRKVIHPQAHDNYRVILKLDGSEFEIGSIGIQHGAAWRWGIDTVIQMRVLETQGKGKDRRDYMRQSSAAWDRFAADDADCAGSFRAREQTFRDRRFGPKPKMTAPTRSPRRRSRAASAAR